jgi:hypothetical protein
MTITSKELARILLDARMSTTTENGREEGMSEIYLQLSDMLLDELFCPEFLIGVMEVVRNGAKKYCPNGWVHPNGVGTSAREQHASMSRHLASSYAGNPIDKESGLYHYQHLATRALMAYTRAVRDITNPKDGE